jgi:hypothetical protein
MAEQLICESKKSKIYLVDDGEWDKPVVMKILNFVFRAYVSIAYATTTSIGVGH